MSKLRYKVFQFMQGRRGVDQFNQFLFIVSSLLLLISMFSFSLSNITYPLGIAIWIYSMFRAFSKNLYKREQENNWYLAKKHMVTGGRTFGGRFGGRFYRRAPGAGQTAYDMQNYVYFKCPSCGQKMRAPRGKGKIKVKCHNCHTEFDKRV